MPTAVAGPALLLVAAAVLFVAAADIPVVPVPGVLGPDVWPRAALIGLALASALKIVQVARRRRHAAASSAWAAPDESAGAIDWPKLLTLLALIFGYAAAAPIFGFPIANLLFLAGFMWVGGLRRPWPVAAASIAVTAVLLYLFVKVVYLPLPRGTWLFHDVTLWLYRVMGII